MASHALKQVRSRVVRLLLDRRYKPLFFLSIGDFTRHRATGADECPAFHAQSQHPRRAFSFHRLSLR